MEGVLAELFSPLTLRSVEIPNRIAMSPMSMYSCTDGLANDWHIAHLGSRASGGVGLIVTEATAVAPEGRITPGDLGLWSDAHADALSRVTRFISERGAVPGIQLAHAGRKGGRTIPWLGNEPIPVEEWGHLAAPSPIAFREGWQVPEAMSEDAIHRLVADFAAATRRAVDAGFRLVEAHIAHGYLLHEFLSPITNRRTDAYGGSLEARAQVPLMVVRAMRTTLPDALPLLVRLSVVDWLEGGITIEDTVEVVRLFAEAGVDLVDCSSGAIALGESIPLAPAYHAPLVGKIRRETSVKTGVVGLITQPRQAEELLTNGTADLIFMARALLRDPYWPRRAAAELGADNEVPVPVQYRRAIVRPGVLTQW